MMKRQTAYSVEPHYSLEVQQMMQEATHCLNCGKRLSYLQQKEGRRNRGFCSLFCFHTKTPKMAYAEKEYGAPVKDVVLKMLNDGASVTATADRLGIGKRNFYDWMRKMGIRKKVMWG